MAVVLKENQLSQLLDKSKEWPGFERMGGEIRSRLEGMMTDYDFIADRWPDISAVVLRPANKLNRAKSHPPCIAMSARNNEALTNLLMNPEVFRMSELDIIIANLDTRLEGTVMDVITSRNISFYRVGPFYIMKTSSEQLKLSPVPDGFSLTSLQPEQSEIVLKYWPYSFGEETECYVKEVIESMPSIALYNEEKTLVGYAITYHNGMLGMLHVMEEHRGQGHAKVMMSQLTALCLEKMEEVLVSIDESNEQSIQLHKRIGFEIIPDIRHVWIICNHAEASLVKK